MAIIILPMMSFHACVGTSIPNTVRQARRRRDDDMAKCFLWPPLPAGYQASLSKLPKTEIFTLYFLQLVGNQKSICYDKVYLDPKVN